MPITKFGPLTVEHNEDWKGEVRVTRGQTTMPIPVAEILGMAGEMLRRQMIDELQAAKPADVLKFKQRSLLTKVA